MSDAQIDRSFVRLSADWTAKTTLDVLQSVDADHAIVQRIRGDETYYYAYDLEKLLEKLRDMERRRPSDGDRPLEDELGLHEYTSSPVTFKPSHKPGAPTILLGADGPIGLITPGPPPDVRGGPSPDATPRALVASAPSEVALGSSVSLLVKLSKDLLIPGSLALPTQLGEEIEVVVQASGSVRVRGRTEGTLTVTDQPETLPLRFKIEGLTLGLGTISIYAFKDGQACGAIQLVIASVVAAADEELADVRAPFHELNRVPDLSLVIVEDKAERSYRLWLSAANTTLGLNFMPYGPITLKVDPDRFFADFYRDIEGILTSQMPVRDRMAQLGVKGTYLLEQIVPEALRLQLWGLRKRIRSMLIQSMEPWIPWELCKLVGEDASGAIVEGGFLCEEFEVTRWLLGCPQRLELKAEKLVVVVPAGSGLPAAAAEKQFLLSMGRPGRVTAEVKPRVGELRAELQKGELDILHFTGHGAFGGANADGSAIALEQGGQLTPQDLTGVIANLGRKRHPLVFLNACEVGRGGLALTGVGGWAKGFLNVGVGAFIAPYWKVADGSASAFAEVFYRELLDGGRTVAQAVQAARAAVKQADDPTWLAYAVYAHPDAKIVPPALPAPTT